MYDLSLLGFDSFFQNQISNSITPVARVAAEHRGGYEVWSNTGDGFAQLSGKLIQNLEGTAYPGVGDWVTLREPLAPGQSNIVQSVLERRTVFIRGAAGRDARGQIVAANVDYVFIVCGLDGDYNVRRIERYLARVWASGAQPVVVLNKADVCDNVPHRIEEVSHSALGVPVLSVSALLSDGVDAVRDFLNEGTTAAFVGSSGAGKSTLINAVLGEQKMATQDVRSHDSHGRHTTTHRQLILLPQKGMVIDTPGMRELQLFDDEGIGMAFSDIEEHAAGCRYRDCTHQHEPGCAVRQAVEEGDMSSGRFENYQKMEAEAHAYETRHNEKKRRDADRAFGKMVRNAKKSARWKQGR